jgi:hypothetical protein
MLVDPQGDLLAGLNVLGKGNDESRAIDERDQSLQKGIT